MTRVNENFSIMPSVDYSLIGSSIEFYKGLGYQYAEVPWEVSTAATGMTCQENSKILQTHKCSEGGGIVYTDSALVGSAEQSFFELWIDNKLPREGSFVACTPCFRLNEPDDQYHFPQFMKVELGKLMFHSENQPVDFANEINVMRNQARSFFYAHTEHEVTEVLKDILEWDLEINNVEIGSYGFRILSRNNVWIYGTGLAEPRFSMVR